MVSDHSCLPMEPLPQTQALACETFQVPPLDGTLTLPELFDWHLENSPEHPLFIYADSSGKEHQVNWRDGACAIFNASQEVRRRVGRPANRVGLPPTIIVVLSAADTLTYFMTVAGILRAGYTVFPISIRNSPAAIAHLLNQAEICHILVGEEETTTALYSSSIKLLNDEVKERIRASPILEFDLIFNDIGNATPPYLESGFDLDNIAFILHSSGSTAFPKPIFWTHYKALQLSSIPYFGEQDMCGIRFACHCIPMSHCLGVMQTGWTATTGVVITGFEPRKRPIIPSPDAVIAGAKATGSELVFCISNFIKAWSQNSEDIEYLSNTRGILYGGGLLYNKLGDWISEQSITIHMIYGCSEIGLMSPTILRESMKKDWSYFRIASNIEGRFIPDGLGNYELVVIPGIYKTPCVLNTKYKGIDAFATGDLLTPHPLKPGYWKMWGRIVDQIVHSTGEKTNPAPLEMIVNQDHHIKAAVIFGEGRLNIGIVIEPLPEHAFDPSDKSKLVDFCRKIWCSIEEANKVAPRHSQITEEFILIASPKKPFMYTAKNTACRQAVISDYEHEINELYESAGSRKVGWLQSVVHGLSARLNIF